MDQGDAWNRQKITYGLFNLSEIKSNFSIVFFQAEY